jgi:hypothetical protein
VDRLQHRHQAASAARAAAATPPTRDGLYIEKIEFFSRDNSRVGQHLSFDYKLVNGDWVHKGLSSKGQPIHEVWGLRE